jgi:hypothetical protein
VNALRIAGAVVAIALAAVLAIAAVDVARLEDTIAADDAQFVVRPARPDWQPSGLLPGTAIERVMGADDDLDYRQALRRVVLLRERATIESGARLSVLVAAAEGALLDQVNTDTDPVRRAEALNLLGALTVADPTTSSFSRGADSGALSAAADRFQEAVTLDPTNEAARENLEIMYRLLRSQGVEDHEADETEKEGADVGAGLGGQGGSGY